MDKRNSLPVAMQGKPYKTQIAHSLISEDLNIGGLEFADGKIIGIPTEPGEYEFSAIEPPTIYELVVLCDPQSLWESHEPEDVTHPTPHIEHFFKCMGEFALFGVSIRGRYHAHKALYREDAFSVAEKTNSTCVVVADGLGSTNYSRRAAQIAVSLVVDRWNSNWIVKNSSIERRIQAELLIGGIRKDFLQTMEDEGLTTAKTTLTIGFVDHAETEDVLTLYTEGDSPLFIFTGGKSVSVFMDSESDYGNETAYFGQRKNVMSGIVCIDLPSSFEGILLSTDGFSDAKFDSLEDMKSSSKWVSPIQKLRNAFIATKSASNSEALIDVIDSYEATHHDDRTLAGFFKYGDQ